MTASERWADTLERTKQFLRERLAADSSGHDWQHTERVWRMAKHLQAHEGGSRVVVELAALLHDVADWKFHGGDDSVGPRVARKWMADLDVAPDDLEHVVRIIETMSFKGARCPDAMDTIEGMIVQDADRLDALGAIGVARAFAYGGHVRQPIVDAGVALRMHVSFTDYKSARTTTVNHFYEKLLLLKDRMKTSTGRAIARERHAFMLAFLDQMKTEVADWPSLPLDGGRGEAGEGMPS